MAEDKIKKKIKELEEKLGEDKSCEYPELGKLYVFSVSEENRIARLNPSQGTLRKSPSFNYDRSSGNVHMFPKDDKIAKLCSDIIQKTEIKAGKKIKTGLRLAIQKKIEGLICRENKTYGKITPGWDEEGKRKESGSSTNTFDNIKKYKSFESLFFYLRVICNNTRYDLCFNRFFFDKDNRVNCVLLSFQVKIYAGNEPKSIDYYPKNAEDETGNEVYYNLGIDIHSSDEEIAKAFLDFVVEREENK